MIKNSQQQTGSVHLVIIIVLIVALLGSLGFIFWQNFVEKRPATPAETAQITQPSELKPPVATYKTFTSSNNGLSFQYLDNWTVSETTTTDTSIGAVSVRDHEGKIVARLQTGAQLGGACDPEKVPTYTTLDASLTNIKAADPIYFGLTAIPNANGGYDVHYGLTDIYSKIETGTVCSNTFYYTFNSGNDSLGGAGFGNNIVATIHYSNLQDVKDFIASDEYKAIKKMASSLTY